MEFISLEESKREPEGIEKLALLLGIEFQLKYWLCARTTNGQPPTICDFMLHYVLWSFKKRIILPKFFVVEVLNLSKQLLTGLPNVVNISRLENTNEAEAESEQIQRSVTVVGDIHGQYDDFYKLLYDDSLVGFPSDLNHVIFNGDLVDRGDLSVEVMVSVLLLKLMYPETMHILRGNHECRWMNVTYGFGHEVTVKYDRSVLNAFGGVFDALPIAAVIDGKVFVVHGGIGPQTVKMDIAEINKLNRFTDPVSGSALFELLWQDPVDDKEGFSRSHRGTLTGHFGPDITEAFLAHNNLLCVVRAHQEMLTGYGSNHNGKCITVFSAPNYMHDGANQGAVLRFQNLDCVEPEIVRFDAVHYTTHRVLQKRNMYINGAYYSYFV